ncbi:hypothetical protein NDU88_003422 [Pleurodeles waltl]|uniref:Uncharacterized protein n=1 Tax=Pleurodeles waltl TaxID=8319 RepID=A0AAV7UE88_PLEWA|nr:hypothetical protein NDU88_003422 [Pleurodeles waltl]
MVTPHWWDLRPRKGWYLQLMPRVSLPSWRIYGRRYQLCPHPQIRMGLMPPLYCPTRLGLDIPPTQFNLYVATKGQPPVPHDATVQPVLPATTQAHSIAPIPMAPTPQKRTQDVTAHDLLSVVQLLFTLDSSSAPVLPTTPCAPADTVENALTEFKWQINEVAAVHLMESAGSGNKGSGDILLPGVKAPSKTDAETGEFTGQNASKSGGVCLSGGTGQDTLLSRPGKLVSHVSSDVKDRIWKGEFVDISSLIRAKKREVDQKDKEGKGSSSNNKKPKVEENIVIWF